jgi:hypothetical protein
MRAGPACPPLASPLPAPGYVIALKRWNLLTLDLLRRNVGETKDCDFNIPKDHLLTGY